MRKTILGDCIEEMRKMPDNSIDVVFTSPPYNRERNDKYENYDDTIEDYFGFLCASIREMQRVCRGNIFLNIQKNYYNKKDVFKMIGEFSEDICEIFVWEKSNPMPAAGYSITNAYEFIIVFGKSLKSNRTYTKNHLTTSVARMSKEHRAMMHMDVAEAFIRDFTKEGDTVLDPFLGTGTTLVACSKLNRNGIGIELVKEYHDIANKRIGL
jgi:DNA modification methylase